MTDPTLYSVDVAKLAAPVNGAAPPAPEKKKRVYKKKTPEELAARKEAAAKKRKLEDIAAGVTLAGAPTTPPVPATDEAPPRVEGPFPAKEEVVVKKNDVPPKESHANGTDSSNGGEGTGPDSTPVHPAPLPSNDPPSWLAPMLATVIKAASDQKGEKISKKKVKVEAEKEAEKKWAEPEFVKKTRALQDKHTQALYKQMFAA